MALVEIGAGADAGVIELEHALAFVRGLRRAKAGTPSPPTFPGLHERALERLERLIVGELDAQPLRTLVAGAGAVLCSLPIADDGETLDERVARLEALVVGAGAVLRSG